MTATRPPRYTAIGHQLITDAMPPCPAPFSALAGRYFGELLVCIKQGAFDPVSDRVTMQRLYEMLGYPGLTTKMQALFDEAIATNTLERLSMRAT
jgi:hypothetical protein